MPTEIGAYLIGKYSNPDKVRLSHTPLIDYCKRNEKKDTK